MKTLESPEQLTQLVDRLMMKASEKHGLNRRMANRARQFFRQQIRAQRDISNNPYQSRTSKTQINNTANNKDMLVGFAQTLRTRAGDKGFEVGLKGSTGVIGRQHNEGAQLSFTTRVNGFFDSKVGQWQGGTLTKRSYRMPKRTFIGWTPQLEKELLVMAAEHFALEDAT